jgi:hypothetical protein
VGKPLEGREGSAEDIKMFRLTSLTEIVGEDVKWIEPSPDNESGDLRVTGVDFGICCH